MDEKLIGSVTPKLFPDWKQTIHDILEQFTYGDFISHEWLNKSLDVCLKGNYSYDEWNVIQLKKLTAIANIKEELLKQHEMYLHNVFGKGYQILLPNNQTGVAFCTLAKGIKKQLDKAHDGILHVNRSLLTTEEQISNTHKLGIIAQLRAMNAKRLDYDK